MRKIFSAILISCLCAAPITAQAWPFSNKPKAETEKKQNKIAAPIKMPGESDETQTQATPQKPASTEERKAVERLDLVAQAQFWLGELGKKNDDEEAAQKGSFALYSIGSYDRAAEVAAVGIQTNDKNPYLWANLGMSLLALDKDADAIVALNRALNLNPNMPNWKNALGVAFDRVDRSDLAQIQYQEALKLSQNDAAILTNLGLSKALSGDLKGAEETLRLAIQNPAAPIQARQNLALVVGLQGRLEESQKIAGQDLPPDIAARNIEYLKQMLDNSSPFQNNPSPENPH